METTKKDRAWPAAIQAGLTTVLALVALILLTLLIAVPKVEGGMSLTVLTGSMRPTISPGDTVVTTGIDTDAACGLAIGDVIVFLPYPDDPTLVTHRIVAKSVTRAGCSFTTRGDNNNSDDSWNPVYDFQIRGKVLYVVPKIGWAQHWVSTHAAWVPAAIGVGLIGYAVIAFGRTFRRPAESPLEVPDDEPSPDDAEASSPGDA